MNEFQKMLNFLSKDYPNERIKNEQKRGSKLQNIRNNVFNFGHINNTMNSLQAIKQVRTKKQKLQATKQKLKSIPKLDRTEYLQQILKVQQRPGPPPYQFKKLYPNSSTFQYNNYNLFYSASEPSTSPSAILLLFHGMGGHSGNSGYFGVTITQALPKVNVYSFDQSNFGRSEGPFRGLISSLEESVQQAEAFVEFILAKFDKKPRVFIGGSSYGGAMCFQMAVKSPQKYSGIIFLAPALRQQGAAHGFLKHVASFLSCILPPVRLFKETEFKNGTKYNCKQRILQDKYVYNDGLVPHTASTVLKSMQIISKQYSKLSTPYILFQSCVDKLVDPFAALDLEQESPSIDKTSYFFEQMWHAVNAEEEIYDITLLAIEWLRKRI